MITLTVNTMDIIAGKRGNAQECAVACAMRRLTGNKYVVSVRKDTVRLIERRTCIVVKEYQTSPDVREFMLAFDSGHIDPSYLPTEYKLRGSLPKD